MKDQNYPSKRTSRRSFIKTSGTLASISTFLPFNFTELDSHMQDQLTSNKSIIGEYGEWAASLLPDPPRFSLRSKENIEETNLSAWRTEAILQAEKCIAAPTIKLIEGPTILSKWELDGVVIEAMEWKLAYGRPTRAVFLRPAQGPGPWPGILGLHDHGGNKYMGWRKIASTNRDAPTYIYEHQTTYYGGVAWANELAKRGYAVLVHDTFTFGSRRVRPENADTISWGMPDIPIEPDQEDEDYIIAYNEWAGAHEHIMSKSLFCAGTTWPGVYLGEDQVALDILAARPEVIKDQLGCCGLSGGGLRTVYLGGLDHRVKCAIAVGFMSTWKDFLLHKSFTHTWMTYAPLLPKYLDFPEILGLRVPLPTMVLNNKKDELFTLPEMRRADEILQNVFDLSGYAERYRCTFYDGPHKFDLAMQEDAFTWFDRWLK